MTGSPACSGRQKQACPTWPWVPHQKITGRVHCSFPLWCSLLCQPGICSSLGPSQCAGCGLPSSSASSGKGISGLAMAACRIRFIWALPDLKLLETGFCIFRESPMYWPWPSLCQLDHILNISGVEKEMAPLWREADWFCVHKDQPRVTQKSCAVAVQTLMSNEMSGDSSLETLCREIFL